MVRDFLAAKLKGDANGLDKLSAEVAASPNATMIHETAVGVAPSPTELVGLARSQGFDSVTAIIARYSRESPGVVVAGENEVNSLGYLYLSQKQLDDR
jgi:hypothetical protein